MLHVDIEEIKSCFKELIQDGIIKKKYKLLNIYVATPQGIQLIIDSAKESDKEGEAVES
ncbi:MAG: hypothetical protein JWN76_2424 [Chitinophagaceae bacterium]|nr:hypothetical protein [Chitinophagaceae bacterium]